MMTLNNQQLRDHVKNLKKEWISTLNINATLLEIQTLKNLKTGTDIELVENFKIENMFSTGAFFRRPRFTFIQQRVNRGWIHLRRWRDKKAKFPKSQSHLRSACVASAEQCRMERGFSCMNDIKAKKRTTMGADLLKNLMIIATNKDFEYNLKAAASYRARTK